MLYGGFPFNTSDFAAGVRAVCLIGDEHDADR
jgi:hypothetical protein